MKPNFFRLMSFQAILVLALAACKPQAQRPRVEELTFQSGEFTLVGDLVLPQGKGPFPVVIYVPGSDGGERWLYLWERLMKDGYASFSWDTPGYGESTGWIDEQHVYAQRAQILLAAIATMKAHPDIDPGRIGLMGTSQGGYVMPLALTQTDDVAFMICASCPGMAGNDQMAYQIVLMSLCDSAPEGAMEKITPQLSELKAAAQYNTYEEYLHYRETLDTVALLAEADIHDRAPILEKIWQENPIEPETYWNPVKVIRQTDIPILAIFGDRDRNEDPFQAEYAWRQALSQTGNPQSRLEMFHADHALMNTKTGCMDESMQVSENYLRSIRDALKQDPYQPGLDKDLPNIPEAFDLIDEWLRGLKL